MNKDSLLENYNYEIPLDLIAQKPVENRQDSRLFVINKKSKTFNHKKFVDIVNYFQEGDCLIINNTKVIPSRLFGKKETGGKVEILFLNPCQKGNEFNVLIKPFVKISKKVYFDEGYECEILSKSQDGKAVVKFNKENILPFLERNGVMPLPPYINRKNGLAQKLSEYDKKHYQTVYAKNAGAIAAPTAGLHFTNEIFEKLKNKGVKIAKLTLHVGWGTFKPILANNIADHQMMSEEFSIDKENVEIINSAIKADKKIAAVGTTSTRALETIAQKAGTKENGKILLKEYSGQTSIFIYPGYKFQIINTLITNLHLPKSTPLMMASAFASRELILKAYKEAVNRKYRFFSYGDSMLIVNA